MSFTEMISQAFHLMGKEAFVLHRKPSIALGTDRVEIQLLNTGYVCMYIVLVEHQSLLESLKLC